MSQLHGGESEGEGGGGLCLVFSYLPSHDIQAKIDTVEDADPPVGRSRSVGFPMAPHCKILDGKSGTTT